MDKENRLSAAKPSSFNIMEVCGTHTMAIARHGLRGIFPKGVRMLSGPGCPVCVTSQGDIDEAIALASFRDITITTFGDMLHVPGSYSSLERERGAGADVRIVYSPMDAVDLAREMPGREVVFLGVGFETTAPTIGAAVARARRDRVKNFSVLPLFKTVPNALRAIVGIKERRIDGFLLPGHVSAIIGTAPYRFLAEEYGIPSVIAGFEPGDILRSVDMLLAQRAAGRPAVEIQYTRLVRPEGNPAAQQLIAEIFEEIDTNWRAIGIIPGSGLAFRKLFKDFDARRRFSVTVPAAKEPKTCRCGDILLGLSSPRQCRLFSRGCSPAHPVGPCMVSSEGACAAEYKYGRTALDTR